MEFFKILENQKNIETNMYGEKTKIFWKYTEVVGETSSEEKFRLPAGSFNESSTTDVLLGILEQTWTNCAPNFQ